ncbi:MAG: DNA polymerase [Paludibacteraceae bacterium]|nr:DNA polymerase [Paludibacteraceae bacterium]
MYKTLILSGIYGQSIKTLSERAGVSFDVGKEIWEGFMGPMKKVTEFRDMNIDYAQRTGYIKTILGEKVPCELDRLFTTANNFAVQGFTAITLAAFFYNCIERAMDFGIDVTSKMVIHDSQTIEFPIGRLFHMDLICKKHFRQACRKYFKADYKFDWDLLLDLMKHMPYELDLTTGIASFTIWSEKVDYLLDHLASSYKFKVIQRDEWEEPHTDGIDAIIGKCKNKYHTIINNERFRQFKQTNLKIQLTERLKNIDWWYEPLPATFSEYARQIKWLDAPGIPIKN